MEKNPPANARDTGDLCLIHGSGRSSGGGNGNLLQYSCLENPTDRGLWWATVQGVAESDTTELLSTGRNILVPELRFNLCQRQGGCCGFFPSA